MRQITKDINTLRDKDIVSILLFCLYKMTDDPEYSIISELAYVLDKESMYKLCSTFGGVTVKIPTIEEYEKIIKIIMIFQKVNIEGKELQDVLQELRVNQDDLESILECYEKLTPTIEELLNGE